MASRPFRLEEVTIDDIHSAFRSGEMTCRRLVELYLARIEAYDKSGPELNSILTINPRRWRKPKISTAPSSEGESSSALFTAYPSW